MTTVIELIEWLNRFHGTDQVAIVDAEDLNLGPSLRILGTPYYYEVGGMPEIGDEKPTKLTKKSSGFLRNYKCPDCGREWRAEASCHRDWDTCGACGRISMPIQE